MALELTPYEAELLAAVEAGAMPIAVYADWLEEEADDRAAGARWLADREKRPKQLPIGWYWPSIETTLSGLPPSVRAKMPREWEPFDTYGEAFASAAWAASKALVEAEIDEEAECFEMFEQSLDQSEPLRRLWNAEGHPLEAGLELLVDADTFPEHRHGWDGWRWTHVVATVEQVLAFPFPHSRLEAAVFRALSGRFEMASYHGTDFESCWYDTFEQAVRDAARAYQEQESTDSTGSERADAE